MPKDFSSCNDRELRSWGIDLVVELRNYAAEHRISAEEMAELEKLLRGFDDAYQEHERASMVLYEATKQKEITSVPMRRVFQAMAEKVNWDPHTGVDPYFDCEPPAPVVEPTQDEPPVISVTAQQGKVIVDFGMTPSWSSGACIYRRKVGEPDFQMLRFVSESPFIDEAASPSAEYEYMARYFRRKANEAGPKSEPVTITA